MGEQKNSKGGAGQGQDAKAERLRAALRANLKRRKAQKRARADKPAEKEQ